MMAMFFQSASTSLGKLKLKHLKLNSAVVLHLSACHLTWYNKFWDKVVPFIKKKAPRFEEGPVPAACQTHT
jgi:hypothetical protein